MSVVQIIKESELIEPGTEEDLGNRLNLKKIVSNKFGFAVCSDDIIYFFKYEANKYLSAGQKKKSNEPKGTYHCIFKWRAKEFRETKILDIFVHEGIKEEESVLGISTKDGQILYVDLYSQIYFPGHQQMLQELKSQDEDELELDSALDGSIQSEISNRGTERDGHRKILTVGIREEMSTDI